MKITGGSKLTFTLRPVPTLSFVKLQPFRSSFFKEVLSPETELTAALEKYTCLTEGDEIDVDIQGTSYVFRIREVQPQQTKTRDPAVGCIVDADIKVEFMEAVIQDATDAEDTQTSAQQVLESSTSQQTSSLTSRIGGSRAQSSTIRNAVEAKGKMCEICRKDIPKARFALHSVQCSRLNIWCQECQAPIRRSKAKSHCHCRICGEVLDQKNLEPHMNKFHREVQCECGERVEVGDLEAHRTQSCSHRLVSCKWCGINVKAMQQGAHEQSCGSKTSSCNLCGISMPRRAIDRHMAAVHKMDPSLVSRAQDYSGPVSTENLSYNVR
eukprot:CAMPEP_0184505576 /NCGR_PEP_ID=MMETSP0113_2-20130426/53060_1 /TAXON_ID=91329 /ORGANISM="Norrisiella sphaerica, Strain BC52" /LENGTH=324 /DNA_ID=CAMNT_0026895275 /DNA_START=518 /DNA_END=1492 /DNA_ORIENTATION=-